MSDLVVKAKIIASDKDTADIVAQAMKDCGFLNIHQYDVTGFSWNLGEMVTVYHVSCWHSVDLTLHEVVEMIARRAGIEIPEMSL